MIVLAANIGETQNEEVRRYVAQYRRNTIVLSRDRLRRGIEEGDVPPNADISAISAFLTTVLHGLSIQAKEGRPATSCIRSPTPRWRRGTA